MQVDIAAAWHIKVNHVAHVWNINPTRGNVGGDQHIHPAFGQTFDTFGTLHLGHLAFKIAVVNTGVTQQLCQLMHALALTNKHDGAGRIVLGQQVLQQGGLMCKVIRAVVPLVDFFTFAGRRCRRDLDRIFQQALGKVLHGVAFQRGGEEHSLLTPARLPGDVLDILGETQLQHAVCFIEDQRLYGAAVKVLFFDVLHKAAGCGDHDILVFAEYFGVVHIGYATGDGGDIQMGIYRQLTGVLGHLRCQLAGRRQDKNTRRSGFLTWKIDQVLQRRQQIRCRFTRAGRRGTEYISALQRRRNSSRLNGSWACEAFTLERVQQAFIEFKFGKSRYSHVLPQCGALIIIVMAAIFISLCG